MARQGFFERLQREEEREVGLVERERVVLG